MMAETKTKELNSRFCACIRAKNVHVFIELRLCPKMFKTKYAFNGNIFAEIKNRSSENVKKNEIITFLPLQTMLS